MSVSESSHPAGQVISIGEELPSDNAWHSVSDKNTTTAYGNITFTPEGLGAGHLRVRLRNARSDAHEVFSNEVTWKEGDLSTKTLATHVLEGTVYTVDAQVGPPILTYFSGTLKTP